MQVVEFIVSYGAWAWIVAGLVLLALELVVPGGILVWMGIAAAITGLVALFQAPPWPVQWLIFGVLSLVSILIWLRWSKDRTATSDRPYLNRRAEQLEGQEAVLDQPIQQGYGRIMLGDTVWRVAGPDLAAGTRVRIVGSEGNVLKVAPALPR